MEANLHTFWMSVKLIIDFEYFNGWAGFETGGRSSMGRRLKMSDVVEDDDGGRYRGWRGSGCVDGGQLIVLSGAVPGVGDDVVVVVMRSRSWYRGRGSADGDSAGWPVSMASSMAVRISGEVSRSR